MLTALVDALSGLDQSHLGQHLYLLVDPLPGQAAIIGDAALGRPAFALVVRMVGQLDEHQLGGRRRAFRVECPYHRSNAQRFDPPRPQTKGEREPSHEGRPGSVACPAALAREINPEPARARGDHRGLTRPGQPGRPPRCAG